MAIKVVKRPMFNFPERVEWYIALEDFPEVPLAQIRATSRDALIAYLEKLLEEARFGEVMEVVR
jgi:hypothetical protein